MKNNIIHALVLVLVSVFLYSAVATADTLFDNRQAKWERQAKQGNKYAQYKLGMAYLLGKNGRKDVGKSIKYFTMSASQGYTKSEFRLGYIYFNNKDGSRRYSKAYKWLVRAAKKNHGMAQYYLAKMYFEGRGVVRNYDQAFRWIKKARAHSVRGADEFMLRIVDAREARVPAKTAKRKAKPRRAKKVTKRYRSPRPKASRLPRGDVAFDTRKVLMSGAWTVGGKPASTLPSSIVSQCEQNATRIKCTSDRIKTATKNYTAHHKIIAIYSDFKSNGSFSVKYKQNYVFVLPEDPDEPNPKYHMPRMGLQDKTTRLNCQIQGNKSIRCFDEGKNLVKFTK
jgi:hypothetical protein